MKILAIGDFHGKFPNNLKKRIVQEDVDLILGIGDYPDTNMLRKLEFKYWDSLDTLSLEDIIGNKKYKELMKKQGNSQLNVLKKIKSLGKPVFLIYGNSDLLDKESKKYGINGLMSQCKILKIGILTNHKKSFSGFDLLAFSGYRGAMLKKLGKFKKSDLKKIKKYNFKWNLRLVKLFDNFNSSKFSIFLAHDSIKGHFDLVKYKKSPLFKKHVGDEYLFKFVKKYKPDIFVAGHMHEYQGIKKLQKTSIISIGAAKDGKATIIEILGNKKFKVRFLKSL